MYIALKKLMKQWKRPLWIVIVSMCVLYLIKVHLDSSRNDSNREHFVEKVSDIVTENNFVPNSEKNNVDNLPQSTLPTSPMPRDNEPLVKRERKPSESFSIDSDLEASSNDSLNDKMKILYVKGEKGERGYPGPKGDPGTFAENSCKFFGSDDSDKWKCPDTYPIYSGASFSGNGMKCNGGVAKNSSCNNKGGVGALGVAILDQQGGIMDVKMIDTGAGYKVPPRVEFIGGGGFGAVAEAILSNGKIIGANVISKGKFYKYPPNVHFISIDYGDGAQGVAKVSEGKVVSVGITNTGAGYALSPIVAFEGGGGVGAEAIAQIQDGRVIDIKIVRGGSGYTFPPVIKIRPRVNEQGCNQCHLCCKRPPKVEKDKILDKQVYDNATKISKQEEFMFKLQKQNDKLFNSLKRLSRTVDNMKFRPVVLDDNRVTQNQPRPLELPGPSQQGTVTQQQIKQIADSYIVDDKLEPLTNWAIDGRCKIMQSSTAKSISFAIDGNNNTHSATNVENKPFIEVDIIQPIEVYTINLLLNKTIPKSRILLLNANKGEVFNQEISGSIIEYNFNNVNKIGKKLKIQIENAEDSLEVKNIEIIGRAAKNCDWYVNKLFTVMKRNEELLIARKLTDKDRMEEKLWASLYESCILMDPEKEKEREDMMQKEAEEYNKIMEDKDKAKKEEAEFFKKQYEQIKGEIEEDKKLDEEARALGLSGIRPKYTEEYLKELQDNATYKPMPRLSGSHGSFCYRLLNKAKQLRNKADNVTSKLEMAPFLEPAGEIAARHSDNANDMYEKYCVRGESPPSIITKNNFFGKLALDLKIFLTPRSDVYGPDYG